jgi:hypothetical protein
MALQIALQRQEKGNFAAQENAGRGGGEERILEGVCALQELS